MGTVQANEISSIIKERIDNFELDPGKDHLRKEYKRGENPLVINVDECAFISDDKSKTYNVDKYKSKMYIVNEYKDGLVYVNHHIDFPLGSIVEFRDAKGNKGILTSYEDGKSIISILGKNNDFTPGKPLWVTKDILQTPEGSEIPFGEQNNKGISFSTRNISFNTGAKAITNDILTQAEKNSLHFICTKCGCVGNTDYFLSHIVEQMIEDNHGLFCEECYYNKESNGIKPTEDEMIIASFSTYNFISKFDQSVPEIVDVDETQPHGVKLGTILSFDDVNIKESSTKITDSLKELMRSLKDKVSDKLGNKVNDKKLNNMIERPNQTMLKIELAEMKRKLKLAKRTNHKEDIEHFQNLYNKTKEQLDITYD